MKFISIFFHSVKEGLKENLKESQGMNELIISIMKIFLLMIHSFTSLFLIVTLYWGFISKPNPKSGWDNLILLYGNFVNELSFGWFLIYLLIFIFSYTVFFSLISLLINISDKLTSIEKKFVD